MIKKKEDKDILQKKKQKIKNKNIYLFNTV